MIIKRTNLFELAMKNIFLFQKNMKDTFAHKFLLSIYIIHNYIIYKYKFVSSCPTVSVSMSVLHML